MAFPHDCPAFFEGNLKNISLLGWMEFFPPMFFWWETPTVRGRGCGVVQGSCPLPWNALDIGDETLPVWNCLSCNFVKWKPFLKFGVETSRCLKKKSMLGKLEIVWKNPKRFWFCKCMVVLRDFPLVPCLGWFHIAWPCFNGQVWLLFLVYYVFATIGVQLFGGQIYEGHPALKGSGFAEGDLVAGKKIFMP